MNNKYHIDTIRQSGRPLLADAVAAMVEYTTDKFSGSYPTKAQTEAVNRYIAYADGDGTMSENNIAHRKIASYDILTASIACLDREQVERLKQTLFNIAADKEYHLPERSGWHR